MRYWIFLLFAVALFASCTPEQRLAHLLKRHPELVKRDTVFHKDTIRIASVSKDTVFKNTVTRDTVIIKQDRLTIKYFNSKDSVFISGKCDSIVKLVNVPVIVNSVEAKPVSWLWSFWNRAKDFIIILMLGALLFVILTKEKKPVS